MIGSDDVKKIAKLAHLSVSDAEVTSLQKELNSILGYVEKLQQANVDSVQPMSHVQGSTNIFREDVIVPSMSNEEALKNAPDVSGRFIRVPIIIEQSGEN